MHSLIPTPNFTHQYNRKTEPRLCWNITRKPGGEVLRVSAPRDTVSICLYPLEAGMFLGIKLKNNFIHGLPSATY